MSERISSTRQNTQRFDRINTSNKFNINIQTDNDDIINYDKSDDMTYLDSIYMSLIKIGVDEKVISRLSEYVLIELFDTEAMDIDFGIEKGGNISNIVKNKTCIECIKNMFDEATSYVYIMYSIHVII